MEVREIVSNGVHYGIRKRIPLPAYSTRGTTHGEKWDWLWEEISKHMAPYGPGRRILTQNKTQLNQLRSSANGMSCRKTKAETAVRAAQRRRLLPWPKQIITRTTPTSDGNQFFDFWLVSREDGTAQQEIKWAKRDLEHDCTAVKPKVVQLDGTSTRLEVLMVRPRRGKTGSSGSEPIRIYLEEILFSLTPDGPGDGITCDTKKDAERLRSYVNSFSRADRRARSLPPSLKTKTRVMPTKERKFALDFWVITRKL